MKKLKERPIRVFFSELGGRFYATQCYKISGSSVRITGKKYDVTDDIGAAITKHNLVFQAINAAKEKKCRHARSTRG